MMLWYSLLQSFAPKDHSVHEVEADIVDFAVTTVFSFYTG